jgi:cytoskeletal protein CcmA (bactofilin family)
VRGHIFGQDVLILGPSAEVHADVEVGTLIIRGGALWGDVRAERLVELYAPARVYGDITTAQIYLDKGVTFEGRCTMLEKSTDAAADKAAEKPAEKAAEKASEKAADKAPDKPAAATAEKPQQGT